MLNINPETVCFIIQRARQFHVKEQVVIPEIPNSPADDWALQMLADHAGPYLMGHPLVADYLQEALTQHGYSCD